MLVFISCAPFGDKGCVHLKVMSCYIRRHVDFIHNLGHISRVETEQQGKVRNDCKFVATNSKWLIDTLIQH